MDTNGHKILKKEYDARGRGKHKDRFKLPKMTNGIYLMQWKCPQNTVTKQVIVKQ
jgi:hypothetical protein